MNLHSKFWNQDNISDLVHKTGVSAEKKIS